MKIHLCCLFTSILGLISLAQGNLQHQNLDVYVSIAQRASVSLLAPQFSKVLRYNVYRFTIEASDSGRVRDVVVKAYRGELLLTNFRIRVDGAVVGAEVADLDGNRFPELYIYSTSDGSGSFGRIYAWQFLPDRKADITLTNWQLSLINGYMGHDSLWVERDILCRKYPIYQAGDSNAEPSGGYRMMRYRLKSVGSGFTLIKDEVVNGSP